MACKLLKQNEKKNVLPIHHGCHAQARGAVNLGVGEFLVAHAAGAVFGSRPSAWLCGGWRKLFLCRSRPRAGCREARLAASYRRRRFRQNAQTRENPFEVAVTERFLHNGAAAQSLGSGHFRLAGGKDDRHIGMRCPDPGRHLFA